LPTGVTIDYVLDAANWRLAKKVNGRLAKSYLWAGGSLVAELDAAGNLETTYVYGRKPHVPEYLLRGSETYRLVTDPLGSVRLVVRVSDGQVQQRLDYSAFGRVLFDSNPGFQPFGYAGGLYEPQTGLIRFGARDYDPEVGRWTAKDPIGFSGGDTNLYGYVVGDPVNLVDPSGTTSWWIQLADGAGNVAAGFGDSISFGITDWVREQMGTNGAVDKCGKGYFGGEVGAFLYDLFKGGSGTIAKAGVKNAAKKAAKRKSKEVAEKAAGALRWPSDPEGMDELLGIPGQSVPDGPKTPGRGKVVWHPNSDTQITYEQHPYHSSAPEYHRGPHWHLDTPGNLHQRYLPGQVVPGQ
jgi:RHS repeat-associated protein